MFDRHFIAYKVKGHGDKTLLLNEYLEKIKPYLKKRSGIPELENRVKKPSYGLWCHKTELSQIMLLYPIFLELRVKIQMILPMK